MHKIGASLSILTYLSTVLKMLFMLNKVIEDLNQTPGIEARFRDSHSPEVDALVEIVVEGKPYFLAIEAKKRAPYPGELSRLFSIRDRIGRWGTPTLVAPAIPESVGNHLVPLGWSWADEQGHYDLRLAKSVRMARRQSSSRSPSEPKRRSLPQGRGGIAIIRLLLTAPRDVFLRTSDLASAAGVTNARASQVVHTLREKQLVKKSSDGWIPERGELLEAFVSEYRGPGGTEFLFYSLDDLGGLAADLVERVAHVPKAVAISADIGPDLVVPWRRPSKLVVYVDEQANIDLAELSEAPDRESANVFIRFPDDRSVFPHFRLVGELGGIQLPLADESQMIWDLYDLGGEDRAEAAQHLSEWLTKNR